MKALNNFCRQQQINRDDETVPVRGPEPGGKLQRREDQAGGHRDIPPRRRGRGVRPRREDADDQGLHIRRSRYVRQCCHE